MVFNSNRFGYAICMHLIHNWWCQNWWSADRRAYMWNELQISTIQSCYENRSAKSQPQRLALAAFDFNDELFSLIVSLRIASVTSRFQHLCNGIKRLCTGRREIGSTVNSIYNSDERCSLIQIELKNHLGFCGERLKSICEQFFHYYYYYFTLSGRFNKITINNRIFCFDSSKFWLFTWDFLLVFVVVVLFLLHSHASH